MYVPSCYEAPSAEWLTDVIRGNPLALLMSNGESSPHATHVPIVLQGDSPDPVSELADQVLLGHMNRSNPHWRTLTAGAPVLLVFTGPHGYVSPAAYETTAPAAPTWDFTAVHVRGELFPIEDRSGTIEVITSTVTRLESSFGDSWDMTSSIEYFDRILAGVGAFRIRIQSVEGMFKLSQEQPPDVRRRLHLAFTRSPDTTYNQLADLMSRLE
jgi:transcriptional regulator